LAAVWKVAKAGKAKTGWIKNIIIPETTTNIPRVAACSILRIQQI
jgi:hypothetical protein